MKKIILLLLFLFLNASDALTQIAFHDALELKNLLRDEKWQEQDAALKILNKYVDTIQSNAKVEFQDNPFIKDFMDWASASGINNKAILNIASAVSGANVTKPVQALSLLMIERAKEELNVAFFQQFKNFVENHEEFQVMFPTTTRTINNLLSHQYTQMVPALQAAFHEDLRKLPDNIDDVFMIPKYRSIIEEYPQITIGLQIIRLIKQLENSDAHPADLIAQFANYPVWDLVEDESFQNMGNSIKIASILSESLRDTSSANLYGWISPKMFRDSLINNSLTFHIYMGLIYQQFKNKDLMFKTNSEIIYFKNELAELKDNLFFLQNGLSRFLELGTNFENQRRELDLNRNNPSQNLIELQYNYISSGLDIIEFTLNLYKSFHSNPDHLTIENYVNLSRSSISLYRSVYQERYGLAIQDLIKVIDLSLKLVNNDNNDVKKFKNKLPAIQRYGLFISNVAQADTPEEIKSAIDAAILPVGSSSIKKNSNVNIALQSYVGGYQILGPSPSHANSWGDRVGVIAPVGISFSKGVPLYRNQSLSLSIFTSLIDIGAVVDYDLKVDTINNTATKDYELQLGQIFSPGGFLVLGLPWNLPLSIGYGAQYGPGLGRIENAGVPVINNPRWRKNLFVTVDLPLVNFYNIPNNRQFR